MQRVIAVSSLYHYYIRRAGERGPAQYSGGACTIVFFWLRACGAPNRVARRLCSVCLVSFGGAVLQRVCALAWVGLRGGVFEPPRSCCVVRQVGAVRGGVAGRISGNHGAVLAARGPTVVRFLCRNAVPKTGPFFGPVFGTV